MKGSRARSQNTGPGRNKRPRTPGRTQGGKPDGERPIWQRGVRLTRRALILGLVVVALAVSYGGALRLYLTGQHDLAVAEQSIRDHTAEIAELEAELARWDDPEFVKAQARDRLGWVMPGETGYRVLGPDGQPLAGGMTVQKSDRLPPGEHNPVWWDRLWGSIRVADAPARRVVNR